MNGLFCNLFKSFLWSIYLLAPLLISLSIAVLLLGQIVTRIEKWSIYDGFYWSLITATTVGYGDIRPLKKSSKGISIFIAFFGMMFTGLIIAITIQAATSALEKHTAPSVLEKIKEDLNS